MKIDLTGSNVLVTGASRGIGRAIAEHLAAAGARVGVHYNRKEEEAQKLVKQLGHQAQTFQCDLSDLQQVVSLFHQVVTQFGSVDILVNNAGIAFSSAMDGITNTWLKDWQATLDVNLTASALLCREAINHWLEAGKGGRIINISSRAAFRGDTTDYIAYAASKGGVVALTRSIARGYGKQNIKAFNIAPGFVRTDMAQQFIDEYGESLAVDDIALPKLTEPQNIAPMVTLLASGLADHATGCTIDINAGSYVH